MEDSLVHDYARSFQDYVRTFSEELFCDLFYGFKTADLATIHEGVKGELTLTELEIADNLARRWAKSFDPVEAATFKPSVIATVLNKVDFEIVPQLYESSYLGALRKKGQDPADWPFQAYIMDKIMKKLLQEFEVAAWQGVKEAAPSAGDYLRQTFNGYLKLITDALTDDDIDAVATGAFSDSNAVAKLRLMWAQVGNPYKEQGTDIMMPFHIYDYYRINYKDTYKVDPAYIQITESGYQGIQFELGNGNTRIFPVHGMGTSGRVVITPRENLHLAIDSPSDVMFRVKDQIRSLQFAMDFRMGAQILLKKPGALVVNDQP